MERRVSAGRRKSDLWLPITLLIIAIAATFWGRMGQLRNRELESRNKILAQQINLLQRSLDAAEKRIAETPSAPENPEVPGKTTAAAGTPKPGMSSGASSK
jgi:hypothetical protein